MNIWMSFSANTLRYGVVIRVLLWTSLIAATALPAGAQDARGEESLEQKLARQKEMIEQQSRTIRQLQQQLASYRAQQGGPAGTPTGAEPAPVSPASQVAPGPDRHPHAGDTRDWQRLAPWVGLAFMGVIALGLIGYYRILRPRKYRKRLRKALELVERQILEDYPVAEKELSDVLVKGLRDRDIAEARFALAYVRARTGSLQEAATVVSEMMRSGAMDAPDLYLALWIQHRLKDYDKVEQLYHEHGDALADYLDSRRMFGMALLTMARRYWERRQVDRALQYFEKLRKLGVFLDQIPGQIEQHQIVHGVMALFDQKLDEARHHFEGAVKTAESGQLSAAPGRIGLLLCAWRSSDLPDIDDELAKAVAELPGAQEALAVQQPTDKRRVTCPKCGKKYTVPLGEQGRKATCKSCGTKFVLADQGPQEAVAVPPDQSGRTASLGKDDLLLRNALLWHAVSLLFVWRRLPAKGGLPREQAQKLRLRLASIRHVDPGCADADLLEGLLGYYFAATDSERQSAVAILDRATGREIHVPEVVHLVQQEHRLAERSRNQLKVFMELLRSYLTDASVPESLRNELRQSLSGFNIFKEIHGIQPEGPDDVPAPSIEDLRQRGMLLHRRIESIVAPRLSQVGIDTAGQEQIQASMNDLDQAAKSLNENVDKFQRAEVDVLRNTSEIIFSEEEATAAASTVQAEVSASAIPSRPEGLAGPKHHRRQR